MPPLTVGLMSLRQAQRRLWELVPGLRQLHASSAAAALAGKPSDEWPPSFASTLKQQSRQFQPRLSTPLTQPLPGIQIIEHDAIPDTEPPTEITTLPNGVRLISEPSLVWPPGAGADSPAGSPAHRRRRKRLTRPACCRVQGPTSAVGIYVNTGSVYETRESAGAPPAAGQGPLSASGQPRTRCRAQPLNGALSVSPTCLACGTHPGAVQAPPRCWSAWPTNPPSTAAHSR